MLSLLRLVNFEIIILKLRNRNPRNQTFCYLELTPLETYMTINWHVIAKWWIIRNNKTEHRWSNLRGEGIGVDVKISTKVIIRLNIVLFCLNKNEKCLNGSNIFFSFFFLFLLSFQFLFFLILLLFIFAD